MALKRLLPLLLLAATAHAQPAPDAAPAPAPAPAPFVPADPSTALRAANTAATAGDWAQVDFYVRPLLSHQLDPADLAEANRLAGLAAFFRNDRDAAELHFLAFLRVDLDGTLDPALVPPEAIAFFDEVRAKHAAELRSLRPRPRRHAALNLLPPLGQFQNGERTKGWILTGMLGTFLVANVSSYLILRSWCTPVAGSFGTSATCDDTTNRAHAANTMRSINITSGLGLIATYIYGVYDGVSGYRRRSREQTYAPYANTANGGVVLGIVGGF